MNGAFNGICCLLDEGQPYCKCKPEFTGNSCHMTAFNMNWLTAAYREMTTKAYDNFTLVAIFLGVMTLLVIALLALFVCRLTSRNRLRLVNKKENLKMESETIEGIAETGEGEDRVDGLMLRHISSRHTGYHSQISYCCNPQHSRSGQCPLLAAKMSHCIIRECPHSPTSPTSHCNCEVRVATPISPTNNGQCGCNGSVASPKQLQSVTSQPSMDIDMA